jgi:hypothetical protein
MHLIGDYWLQNDWMALNKKKKFWIALVHGAIYTLPFMLLTQSKEALVTIWLTHALIDGTNWVFYLNRIKNWNFSSIHGYRLDRPEFIWVWLIIIQDNILHLVINYCALRWL